MSHEIQFPKPTAVPNREANGAVQRAFVRLPQRLQDNLPSEFHPDVKDVLEQMLELERTEPYADELRRLIAQYADEEPATVDRVHRMLGKGKEAKTAGGFAVAVAELTADTPAAKLQQATEIFSSAEGIAFLNSISIASLTSARVHEKLQNIDKEIQNARENGMHDYAEELKRIKTEFEDKKTRREEDTYAQEVVTRMQAAHNQASMPDTVAGECGATVAVLLVAGWLTDVTAPKAVASPSGPRVMRTKS